MRPVVLIVGEKPSVAQSIAQTLSNGPYKTVKSIATPVHEVPGKFNGTQVLFRITSVTGHVMNLDFTKPFNDWHGVDPKDLFTATTAKSPADKNGKVCRHLRENSKRAQFLILWLDCDREGENICFEVIQQCKPQMLNFNFEKSVFRARFSSLSKSDILKAMINLKKPNANESLSVDARQIIDLKVGVAFTRFQTMTFNEKYANLNSECISYGPCQIPTLGFCVDRHDKIQKFVPKPFWFVRIEINSADTPSRSLSMQKYFDQKQCLKRLEEVNSPPRIARVADVKISKNNKSPPLPLNTLNLLKEASSKLLIGPSEAMSLAERLYLSGYTTYPRTESTKFPKSFDYRERINSLVSHSRYGGYAKTLLQNGHVVPKGGVDCGDHEPISPVKNAFGLSGRERSLFDLIARSFLAAISPVCTYQQMNYKLKVLDETLELKASKMINPSFTVLDPCYKLDSTDFPLLKTGRELTISKAEIVSDKTRPPSYISETELLSKMFKNGIGTDASMPTHIKNITNRNYVALGPNRTLVPTQLGIVLVHGYKLIDNDLVHPSVRAKIEGSVDKIARGMEKMNDVVFSSLQLFARKFDYFVQNIEKMDMLFQAHFDTLKESRGKPFSKCGECNRYMKFIESRPVRLACLLCDKNYKIPLSSAKLKLFKEKRCAEDNFELLFLDVKGGDSYVYCPKCVENYGSLCQGCGHENCEENAARTFVKDCPLCGKAVTFRKYSDPKWTLRCTGCPAFNLKFKKSNCFNEISLAQEEKCNECHASKFLFTLKGAEKRKTKECAFCSDNNEFELMAIDPNNGSRNGFDGRRRASRGRRGFSGRSSRGRRSRSGRGRFQSQRGRGARRGRN